MVMVQSIVTPTYKFWCGYISVIDGKMLYEIQDDAIVNYGLDTNMLYCKKSNMQSPKNRYLSVKDLRKLLRS